MRLLDWLGARTAHLKDELSDSSSTAVYLRQLLRGNRVSPAEPPTQPVSRTPVLLVHGYFATRGSLHLLERRLQQRGHVVFSYRLGLVNFGSIQASAELIARKVDSLVAQTQIDKVDIVGHSMGGLVGLYYIKRLGGAARVRRMIMLGTPLGGSAAALLGLFTVPLGRASLQLLPQSAFLRQLNETPLPPGVDVTSIVGERDHLAPSAKTALAGVRHLSLPTSHSGMLVDAPVAEAVDALLRAPDLAAAPEDDS